MLIGTYRGEQLILPDMKKEGASSKGTVNGLALELNVQGCDLSSSSRGSIFIFQ